MDQAEVIKNAIDKAGGVKAVAKAMQMSEEGVRLWHARGRVPAERVVELEQLTGVPREALRPDLYERPTDTAPQQAA